MVEVLGVPEPEPEVAVVVVVALEAEVPPDEAENVESGLVVVVFDGDEEVEEELEKSLYPEKNDDGGPCGLGISRGVGGCDDGVGRGMDRAASSSW